MGRVQDERLGRTHPSPLALKQTPRSTAPAPHLHFPQRAGTSFKKGGKHKKYEPSAAPHTGSAGEVEKSPTSASTGHSHGQWGTGSSLRSPRPVTVAGLGLKAETAPKSSGQPREGAASPAQSSPAPCCSLQKDLAALGGFAVFYIRHFLP